MKQKTYALVYQAGIANVFEVASPNLADFGRDAVRILQSDFRECEAFSRGLAKAGHIVHTLGCNMAGNITHLQWTDELDSLPFCDQFRPVTQSIAEIGPLEYQQ